MTLSSLSKGVLGALTIATAVATTSPASADYYYRHHRGWNAGGAAAVGVLGGLALGAALAAPRPAYGYGYRPAYGYGYAAPVYAPEPVYAEPVRRCWIERHRVWVPGWGYDIRRERVCSY